MRKGKNLAWKSQTPWLILLILTDLFFIFLTWLIGPATFGSIAAIILLFTVLIIFAGCWLEGRRRKKQREALQAFLLDLDEEKEQQLIMLTDEFWYPIIGTVSEKLREQAQLLREKKLELQKYQEFIEAWTHEIKTPLSLATLVLANHKEEMSTYVYNRMEHIRSAISSDVELILYYARLQAEHVDYKFGQVNLSEFVQECLRDFQGISKEKEIDIQLNLSPLQVISDKKVLAFILAQLFSNAFKYAAVAHGVVSIVSWSDAQDEGKIHLVVRDNGQGVPPEDLPFLFDKGFTGNHPERQNATGMGLYLVKKYAEALSIAVIIEPSSTTGQGFGIELIFPKVIIDA